MDLEALIRALEENTEQLRRNTENFLNKIAGIAGNLTAVGKERILKEKSYFDRFDKTGLSFNQSVQTLHDGIKVGIRNLSKPLVDLVGVTKRLNLYSKDYLELFAVNVQAIKASEDATLKLIEENIALGQKYNRSSNYMTGLLQTLMQTGRVLALQSGPAQATMFQSVGQRLGAVLDQQVGDIGGFLNKLTGTTLQDFSNLARVGIAQSLSQQSTSEAMLEAIIDAAYNIDQMYRAIRPGLSFDTELFTKMFGFNQSDLRISQAILDNQVEIRNALRDNNKINDNQLAFFAALNDFTRTITTELLPYGTVLLEALTKALNNNMPIIINYIRYLGDRLEKLNLEEKISKAVGWLSDKFGKLITWLTETLTFEKLETFFVNALDFSVRLANVLIQQGKEFYHWLRYDAWDDIKSFGKTLGLIAVGLATKGLIEGYTGKTMMNLLGQGTQRVAEKNPWLGKGMSNIGKFLGKAITVGTVLDATTGRLGTGDMMPADYIPERGRIKWEQDSSGSWKQIIEPLITTMTEGNEIARDNRQYLYELVKAQPLIKTPAGFREFWKGEYGMYGGSK